MTRFERSDRRRLPLGRQRKANRSANGVGLLIASLFAGFLLTVTTTWGRLQASDDVPSVDPEGKRVDRIILEADGPLSRVTPEECLRLIRLTRGDLYSASAVQQSIVRLHATEAFHDIRVQFEMAGDDSIRLVYQLLRRHIVEKVSFKGRLRLSKSALRSEFTLSQGSAYSDSSLERGLQSLRRLYNRNGYYRPRIMHEFKRDEEEATLSIHLSIDAGYPARLAEMDLQLPPELSQESLLPLMTLRRGAPYSRRILEGDVESIKNHLVLRGYLRCRVEVEGEEYLDDANQVRVSVRVEPGPRQELELIGVDLEERRLLELAIFRFQSVEPAFARESAQRLKEISQEEGYFQAQADFRYEPPEGEERKLVLELRKGEPSKVKSILFEGCDRLDGSLLLGIIGAREAGFFGRGRYSARIAERDLESIRSFYYNQGFLDTSAQHELRALPDDAGHELIYRVQEGPRYRIESIAVTGSSLFDEADLTARLQSRPGDFYSPLAAGQDRIDLIAAYDDQGYQGTKCRLEIEQGEQAVVRLEYQIEEGQQVEVDDVVVSGLLRTRRKVIDNELRVQPGEPLSTQALLQSERNLQSLAVFDRIRIEQTPAAAEPDSKLLVVHLEEAPRYTILYGLGFSSFEGLRGTLGVSDNNFLGRAQTMAASVRASRNRQRASLSWTVPRLKTLRWPTVFTLAARNDTVRRGSEGESRTVEGRPFDEFRLTASARSERQLSRRESMLFGLSFESVRTSILPGLEDELGSSLSFFRVENQLRLSSLQLSYINESRDVPSDPSQGFFLSGDASLSTRALGSEEEFFRILTQGHHYYALTDRLLLATSVRLGWIRDFSDSTEQIENQVPISERFFSGGSTTLRGLPQDLAGPLLRDRDGEVVLVDDEGRQDPNGRPVPIGGNALLIGNIELRAPLWRLVSGTIFYDVGNVFDSFSAIRLSDFTNTIGLGLRFRTPVGPIRFDAGYNPNPPGLPGFSHWNFHISLGQAF